MIAFNNLSLSLGQLMSYVLGAAFTDVPQGWRIIVAIGGVPPSILFFLLPWCPESPRQLISHGKMEEAARVIARVYPHATDAQVRSKTEYIAGTIETEAELMADKSLWWQFKQLHCVPANFRALVSACAIMASKY